MRQYRVFGRIAKKLRTTISLDLQRNKIANIVFKNDSKPLTYMNKDNNNENQDELTIFFNFFV